MVADNFQERKMVADDVIADAISRLVKLYTETAEVFLRSMGVDESNVQEYEFREIRWDYLPNYILRLQELWQKNVFLGQIVIRLDDSNGIRYIVECQPAILNK